MTDPFDKYRQYDQDLRDAYAAGLDAAREAVAGTRPEDHPYPQCDCPYCCDVALAVAAIDALREASK